jgi:hypothetical protein
MSLLFANRGRWVEIISKRHITKNRMLTYRNKYTDKKENKMFLLNKEIQMGSGAKSYMRKGFLIYEEMYKYFHHTVYEEVVSYI